MDRINAVFELVADALQDNLSLSPVFVRAVDEHPGRFGDGDVVLVMEEYGEHDAGGRNRS